MLTLNKLVSFKHRITYKIFKHFPLKLTSNIINSHIPYDMFCNEVSKKYF